MTLIEALKSGKNFQRPGGRKIKYEYILENLYVSLTREEILATDWEPIESTVTINKEQLQAAYEKAYDKKNRSPVTGSMLLYYRSRPESDDIAKELGL